MSEVEVAVAEVEVFKFAVLESETHKIHAIIEVEAWEEDAACEEASAKAVKMGIDMDLYYLEHESFVPAEDLLGFQLAQVRQQRTSAKASVVAVQARIDGMLALTGFDTELEAAELFAEQLKEAEKEAYGALAAEMVRAYGEDEQKRRAA